MLLLQKNLTRLCREAELVPSFPSFYEGTTGGAARVPVGRCRPREGAIAGPRDRPRNPLLLEVLQWNVANAAQRLLLVAGLLVWRWEVSVEGVSGCVVGVVVVGA